MRFGPLRAMVRKDLLLFFSDRRSVIVAFVVPIAIASFFGSIFSGTSTSEPARIKIAVVDRDSSVISRGILASVQADRTLAITQPTEEAARDEVKGGKTSVAVIIPKDFGNASGKAFLGIGPHPTLELLFDPSRRTELAMVRGILSGHVIEAVSREMFGGAQGRALIDASVSGAQQAPGGAGQSAALVQMLRAVQGYYNMQPDSGAAASPAPSGLVMPYAIREEAVTSGANVKYNGYAHSFGGMAVQFLLFAMANLGIDMLLERQRGLWMRLRSAPLARNTLLAGKALSGTIISLMTLWVSFAFAMIVFRVRIEGSILGFVAISISCAIMAATFGLLVAALGKTPATARGVTTLAVLMMVMLGGAWVPTFVFPAWLQQATKVVPVRWAVDGFDSMTWRGLGLRDALPPTAVLLGFALVFGLIAANRFRWEES
ncbi:MAG: ABC transporter permease [Gemmatimonadota bacterium]